MKKSQRVVEYLCFGCGAQGMIVDPSQTTGEPLASEPRCPHCGRKVFLFDFRLTPVETVAGLQT
ncbi:MAG: hypothetical protein M1553_07270 [Firmicutes bacterium]|nr:hypothetical protein [Bacillota bacterium]